MNELMRRQAIQDPIKINAFLNSIELGLLCAWLSKGERKARSLELHYVKVIDRPCTITGIILFFEGELLFEKVFNHTLPVLPVDLVKAEVALVHAFGGALGTFMGQCMKCDTVLSEDGRCYQCEPKISKAKPSERGMHLCLEPKCRKWVRGTWCKAHVGSECPIVDREGDAIWMTRELKVLKVKDLGDEHLTNVMAMLEGKAGRRKELTGKLVLSKFYPSIVAELRRRDRCMLCNEGILAKALITEGKLLDEEVYCDCQLGKEKVEAKALALKIARESKKSMTLRMATVLIVTLILGGSTSTGAHFIAMVIAHLREMGCIR